MEKREFAKLNQEQMIIAFNDLKDDYRQLFAINADLEEEKQQLIKFLVDKIKEYKEYIDTYKKEKIGNCKLYCEAKLFVYQEVLDFVEKGGKE